MKEGFEFNVYIVVTLLTIYSDCSNSLEDFQKLCSCVAIWDQISWNAVIAGFSNIGSCEEALKCFSDMRQARVAMNFFTFASILRAVGTLSDLEAGKKIHALVFKSGQASNFCVQNGLVSMYARCGAIHDSKWVFTLMNEHDVVSWNSLLAGYAHHGFGLETVELFEQMRRAGFKPDNTTFLIVLTACSHVGLVHQGLMYFDLMRNDDLLEPPRMEHYATVVDLFGRAGNLHEAQAFVDSMPIEPGPSVYKALLSACKVHGNKEIALRSAKKLQELCPNDPATYILLSNVLVTGGCWDDAAGVRKLMYDRGIRKTPGHSWI
ncbi:PREDICTED: pentatricopeptide repeat-containing protein At3g24000, mitochondrial [Prunus mume]|uniref:Pentatricopeptide repeat-containing protein At3g24000, mitochondrial n=1 Tax=Prunus mume TaxID=102107 RepID=A0ABM0NB66_PRUMU|nr:PREDICTED: pentatricopeptide repeat-containing protein At3g24000, mitochondrial [Prunus mume]